MTKKTPAQRLREFIHPGRGYPGTFAEFSDDILAIIAENEMLRQFVGDESVMSDYQTVGAMRAEIDSLRGAVKKSFPVPTAWGEAIATLAVPPMTGQELFKKFLSLATGTDGYATAWDSLSAHIWPNARPSRREQLRSEIKWTYYLPDLIVGELRQRCATVMRERDGDSCLWLISYPGTTKCEHDTVYGEAIITARDYLIDEALKQECDGAE